METPRMRRQAGMAGWWMLRGWPGGLSAWRGSWPGLAVAVGFAAIVNFALVATFVWTEWVAAGWSGAAWVAAGVMIGGGVWWSRREPCPATTTFGSATCGLVDAPAVVTRVLPLDMTPPPTSLSTPTAATPTAATPTDATPPQDDLFSAAITEYLQGNLLAAERQLLRLVEQDRNDIEGQLLLATIWRRMNRQPEARKLLQRLATRERAEKWQTEIEHELTLLSATRPAATNDASTTAEPNQHDIHDAALTAALPTKPATRPTIHRAA